MRLELEDANVLRWRVLSFVSDCKKQLSIRRRRAPTDVFDYPPLNSIVLLPGEKGAA